MQKMPCKKKKYNSRFPPARIKKIMQSDDEVGKVAAVVPIIISRVLEIFVENLLKDSCKITKQRNARTLTPAHIKATILQNNQLDFLKEIVSLVPDIQTNDDQLDHSSSNYTDYYPHPVSNSNHHRLNNSLKRQFSHPSTSNHNQITISRINTANDQNDDNNQLTADQQQTSSTLLSVTGLSSHMKQTTTSPSFLNSSNKRFNTYSRSNSAPSSTNDLLINSEELRSQLKNKRKRRRQDESTNYEDLEEDDEEYDLSSDEEEEMSGSNSNNKSELTGSKNETSSNNHQLNSQLPCSSTTAALDNKLEDACKVSRNKKLDIEDDDYDA